MKGKSNATELRFWDYFGKELADLSTLVTGFTV